MSQENIRSNACRRDDGGEVREETLGLEETRLLLTAVKLKHQQDGKVVEEGAVQDEGDERGQPAVSRRRRRLDPVGVHLAQNFNHRRRGQRGHGVGFTAAAVLRTRPLADSPVSDIFNAASRESNSSCVMSSLEHKEKFSTHLQPQGKISKK